MRSGAGKYIELLYLLSKSSPAQTLQLAWLAALPVSAEPIPLPRDGEEVLCEDVRRIPKNKGQVTHEGNFSIVGATDSEGMDDGRQTRIVRWNNSSADDSLVEAF